MDDVDCRRLFSIRPETGPGEDSRDGGPSPGESERTEASSERAPGEGECERLAGEVDLDVGLDSDLPTWGSDLLRPRAPKSHVSSDQQRHLSRYALVGGLRLSARLFVSGSKLGWRETGAGSILMVGAGNWSA